MLHRKVLTVEPMMFRTLLVLLVTTVSGGALSHGSAPPSQTGQETVWRWFENCGENRTLGLEVQLDGNIIHRSSFPICQISDRPNTSERQQRKITFHFKGGHVFQGRYHTVDSQMIEGNIWQAGADPDAVLLGVSFSTKDQVLLNTIHIAKPGIVSTSEVDRGVVVRTFPVRRK
ncbi:MAG TPA: hypothetical protein VK473_17000 [Terriglobales bacterium]|nr:hypothetical protein [Terriglobales bacterium]